MYGTDKWKVGIKRGLGQTRLSCARGEHLLIVLTALVFLCSCGTASVSRRSSNITGRDSISAVADRVWAFSQHHPKGFTLDVRTMREPKAGIAVAYAATQNSHTRNQLDEVVGHALRNDGYVGGWYNDEDSLYYFDSTRLFPEDSLERAIRFGRENGQLSVYVISSSTDVPIVKEHSLSVFLVMYDEKVGKEPLQRAIAEYGCEVVYDYKIIKGMALKKPDNRTLEETMKYFRGVKGVVAVEYDRITRLTDPVKPRLEER